MLLLQCMLCCCCWDACLLLAGKQMHMHVFNTCKLQLTRGLQVGTALLHRSAPELQGAETHLLGTK